MTVVKKIKDPRRHQFDEYIQQLAAVDIDALAEKIDSNKKYSLKEIKLTIKNMYKIFMQLKEYSFEDLPDDTVSMFRWHLCILQSLVCKEIPEFVSGNYYKGEQNDSHFIIKKTKDLYKEFNEKSLPNITHLFSINNITNPVNKEKETLNGIIKLLHPAVVKISKAEFEDGHFAKCVLSAFIEVNNRVKEFVRQKTGEELDGADLMHFTFSPKKPIIILGDLTTETGRSMQQGYMEIFAGSMMGIRNPKAHNNIVINKEQAIHFLFVASLLMNKLDEVKI